MDIQIVIGKVIKMKGKTLLDMLSILDQQLSLGCPKSRVFQLCQHVKQNMWQHPLRETIWLKNLLKEFDHPQEESIIIYVDNKSAIKISENPVQHGRSKHIDMKYYFLRDYVKQKVVKLQYCNTEEQVANIFTKALPVDRFRRLRIVLGVKMLLV